MEGKDALKNLEGKLVREYIAKKFVSSSTDPEKKLNKCKNCSKKRLRVREAAKRAGRGMGR